MFNDDKYTTEERAGGVWGALLVLLAIGSCANTPKNVNQEKAPEKVPVKIEHRESPATNQVYQVRSSYLIHVR